MQLTIGHLTIGQLAKRTGVATSALRYWEEIGLLPPPARISGQRRYAESAVQLVGMVLLLQEVGFTLREVKGVVAPAPAPEPSADDRWRALVEHKLNELDQRIAQAQEARRLIAHSLACPHDDIRDCPSFAKVVADRLSQAL